MDVKETSSTLLGNGFAEKSVDKSSMGKDDFMKLLLAQMENQDPMNPQDSTEYTAQLAQLSSLEELQNLNDSMDTLAVVETAGTNSQTVSYIGKTVEVAGNEVTVDASGKMQADMYYAIPENAESVDITITDENGKTVRTIKAHSQGAGKHKVEWDGLDDDGNPVPEGTYSFDVAAVNNEGGKVDAFSTVKGKVTGITYENGYPELLIGGQKSVLGNVVSVDGESESEKGDEPEAVSLKLERINMAEQILTKNAQLNNIYNIGR